jgi:hypothetical protein
LPREYNVTELKAAERRTGELENWRTGEKV